MKNIKAVKLHSRIAALCLVLSIFATSTMFVLAAGNVAGEIIVSGEKATVTLNGEKVFSGRTFFSSGVIATADNSAVVNLGKAGRVSIAPNSVVSLSFTENSISGEVTEGSAKVLNNEGVTVNVKGTEADAASSQNSNKKAGYWVPLAILGGAVGAAILFVTLNRDDDVTSPNR